MYRVYPFVVPSLCLPLMSQLPLAAVDIIENSEPTLLFSDVNTPEKRQLVSDSAEINNAVFYPGREPSLVIQRSGGETTLDHAFAPDEDLVVRTELRIHSKVNANRIFRCKVV